MLCCRYALPLVTKRLESIKINQRPRNTVVCAAKGPRPRYPQIWKSRNRIGTVSKSAKLVTCVKQLSNVNEEVYGALDLFIAWELEFPLITMLSKGQGRTMGTYFTLLNALAEDGRLEEAEELWVKLFSDNLESTPSIFFDKMISIYYHKDMHEKMFELCFFLPSYSILLCSTII
ncbi:hypothetical protein ES319_D09G027600v1 [Gossypium barbadense]|uniref:Pentatricopeptide repeat-containing protein n=1 Tax=Gossypium barbadense TaxID=3634 RepID=A0A5J5PYE6_GOSBA|nr:hypothetical protein ES319_D09G027600v1 [Gossypium barbadense]